jgi:hypothetical protein
MNQDVGYPILYGALRGTLKSIAYSHTIPGVEIKDVSAFAKWLNDKVVESEAFAREWSEKNNQKSS